MESTEAPSNDSSDNDTPLSVLFMPIVEALKILFASAHNDPEGITSSVTAGRFASVWVLQQCVAKGGNEL